MTIRFLILIPLLAPTALHAADLFVAKTGNIQAVVDRAQPGDTIHIAPGQYREQVILRASGTANRPIIISGSGAGSTIIDGADPVPTNAWVACGERVYRLDVTRWTALPTLALWEDGERLTAAEHAGGKIGGCRGESAAVPPAVARIRLCRSERIAPPPRLRAGTYYVPPPSLYSRAAAARHFCPAAPLTTAAVLYLRPRHPRFPPAALRMELATRGTLLLAPAEAAISHVQIQDLSLVRSASDAARGTIELQATREIQLARLRFQENGSMGVRGEATQGLTLTALEMTGALAPYGGGIRLTAPTRLTVQNNFIHDNEGPGIQIVYDAGLAAASPNALRIVDNILWANTGANIQLQSTTPFTTTVCDPADRNTLLKGNVIVGAYANPDDTTATASGLALQAAGNVLVRENLFVGNQHALSLDAGPALCQQGRAKLSDNLLLFSFGEHIRAAARDSTRTMVRNNLYSRQRDDAFLQGLFAHSEPVLTFATPVAAPNVAPAIDRSAKTLPIRHTVLNGQMPFVYAPPTGMGRHEALTVIRLAGGEGAADIQLALSAISKTTPLQDLRVTLNGRLLPLQHGRLNQLIGRVELSPWQNWLVVSTPQGLSLDLVRIKPSRA